MFNWTRSEICSPASLAAYVNADNSFPNDPAPAFDNDNDLVFGRNGVLITFAKPITDYQWVEITFVNLSIVVSNPQISIIAYPDNNGLSQVSTLSHVPVALFSEFTVKIPIINQIEQLRARVVAADIGAGQLCIKSIKVLQRDDRFEEISSPSRCSLTMTHIDPGCSITYDALTDIYNVHTVPTGILDGSFNVTGLPIDGSEYAIIEFINKNTPAPFVVMLYEGLNTAEFATGLKFTLGADNNIFPHGINFQNAEASLNSDFIVKLRIGRWYDGISAFGGSAQRALVTAPAFNPLAQGFLAADNNWTGHNNFAGQTDFGGVVKIQGLTGYLKAAAGIVAAVATIPWVDISGVPPIGGDMLRANNLSDVTNVVTARANLGLGTIATFAAGQYLFATNNLSDVANAGTARTNLGLGTAAVHPAGDFLLTANNLSDVNAVTGRANLGLGTVATHPATDFLLVANNLSDVNNVATSRTSLGLGTGNSPTFTGLNLSGSTAGGIFYSDVGKNIVVDAVNFNWDYTNKTLLVGSSAVATDRGISLTKTLNVATSFGYYATMTYNSSVLTAAYNYYSFVSVQSAVFTLPELSHFKAGGLNPTSATVTNHFGFSVASTAVGYSSTLNAGFHSAVNSATGTWQLYMAGTAPSYFAAPVGILNNNPAGVNTLLYIAGTHPSAAVTVSGITVGITSPTTATTSSIAYQAILASNAAAYTVADLIGHSTGLWVKGAGSTITNAKGFFASNNIAGLATNTYGFFSDIASATTTWQLYMSGTGQSYFGGPIGLLTNNPGGSNALFLIGLSSTHPSAATAISVVNAMIICPVTTTAFFDGFVTRLDTTASVFTCTTIRHFLASITTKGAGSTITNTYGFFASNSIIAAGITLGVGFYSDINAATGVYQLNMNGTAQSRFGGSVIFTKATVFNEVTITYSASMTPDASLGDSQIITVTNATAMAINVPTNPSTGQRIRFTIRNTSGGAMGVITWNAVFKMPAFTNPATAFSRTIEFEYNGTNWIEHDRSAADCPV